MVDNGLGQRRRCERQFRQMHDHSAALDCGFGLYAVLALRENQEPC